MVLERFLMHWGDNTADPISLGDWKPWTKTDFLGPFPRPTLCNVTQWYPCKMLCQWRLESRMFSIVCTAVKVTCAVIFNQGLFQVTSLLVSAYASTDKLKILNYSQEIFSKYLPPFLPNTGVKHHRQFDHKYWPGQPKIDTADTENKKK